MIIIYHHSSQNFFNVENINFIYLCIKLRKKTMIKVVELIWIFLNFLQMFSIFLNILSLRKIVYF